MLRNEALHVNRGQRGTLTTQLLDIRDDDNPQDVVVEVLDPPLHGQLLQTLQSPAAPIYQFRLDELSRGLLQYVHDGSDSTSDVVVLQANDGHSIQNILFHVKTVPKVGVIPRPTHPDVRFCLFFFFLMAVPAAYGSSWPGVEPEPQLQPMPQL